MIESVPKNKCTGCCACLNSCPKGCIHMVVDSEGFFHPIVDEDACTKCGTCIRKCPIHTPINLNQERFAEAHAVWSLDEEVRFKSTSGGAFSEIARYILESGGLVVGARYTKTHLVEHCMIASISGIEQLRQSKYIQSSIGTVFRDIKSKLTEGKRVLFCGTPCQNAGLLAYLGNKPENLVLLDFICRGVNSPKAYRRYLDMLEQKHNSKISRVWFKYKIYGWNRFSTRIDFENGKQYVKDRYTDLFMRGYLEFNLYMRSSCHSCQFKGKDRLSDLTLADFWGGGKIDASFDPDKGTSLVIAHSGTGKDILKDLSNNRLFVSDILDDRAYNGNICIGKSPAPNKCRELFLQDLDTLSFDKALKKYANLRKSPQSIFRNYVSYIIRRLKLKKLTQSSHMK